jgi:DNA ligase-1
MFDCFDKPEDPFRSRLMRAEQFVRRASHRCISVVEHVVVQTPEEFARYAEETISLGYEGVMLRDPEGPYKEGRSTLKQQWLVKYKEWADAEGTVVGFEERMHNANEDIKDNFGHAKRTSHQENMVPMGTLGALILDTKWGELRVGTGFDDALRQEIWDSNREPDIYGAQMDLGRIVTFKYQAFGMQDKPRFPVFLHFREDE